MSLARPPEGARTAGQQAEGPPVSVPASGVAAASAFDAKAFRNALGCFPTGVAVMTTRHEGELVGLTCNSFSSVSLDPPLVLWSLRTGSKSLAAFRASRTFAINILAEDQNLLSARFASSAIADKFEGVHHSAGLNGVPVIDDCVVSFECSTFAEHDAGDHVLFIGRVERFAHGRQDDPLVFYRGAYMMVTQSLRELSAKGRVLPRDLDEARALLYSLLLRLACENGTVDDFDEIERLLRKMEPLTALAQMGERAALAVRFFQLIAAAAHNGVLAIVADSLSTLLHHAISLQLPSRQRHDLVPVRWRILQQLRARNGDAAVAAMQDYAQALQSSGAVAQAA